MKAKLAALSVLAMFMVAGVTAYTGYDGDKSQPHAMDAPGDQAPDQNGNRQPSDMMPDNPGNNMTIPGLQKAKKTIQGLTQLPEQAMQGVQQALDRITSLLG